MLERKPNEKITDAKIAFQMLKEGNQRFISGELSQKSNDEVHRELLESGQSPFAIVLCCADSRVAPEIYFDQQLGDLFVIRNAGNVVDDIVLGSIEYGVEHLGSPLVVVVGHTNCGAVTAAYQGGDAPRNISSILKKIQPSILEGLGINEVAIENAKAMASQIAQDEIVQSCKAKVIPALYDIRTGIVQWLEED